MQLIFKYDLQSSFVVINFIILLEDFSLSLSLSLSLSVFQPSFKF